MAHESVVALVKDLTARLSAVAEEFAGRADLVDPAAKVGAERSGSPVARARALIEERRLRRRFLPDDLFHEPAWDMLLALYVAHHERRIMNVKTLVATSDAPVTTSQRWIEHLGKLRLVDRVTDPMDRRRTEVSLSDAGREAIDGYLAALG